MTTPREPGKIRRPAVVLVAGSGSVDRDEVVAEFPIFAQIAAGLADRGFVVLRCDKRVEENVGRNERVTIRTIPTTSSPW
jgi:hypothetical protein